LLLVQISDFKGFNAVMVTRPATPCCARCGVISECCAPGKACSVTRLGGGDFAVVAALTTASDAELPRSRNLPGAATTAIQFPGRYGDAGVCRHRAGRAAQSISDCSPKPTWVTRRADRRRTVVIAMTAPAEQQDVPVHGCMKLPQRAAHFRNCPVCATGVAVLIPHMCCIRRSCCDYRQGRHPALCRHVIPMANAWGWARSG